MANEKSTHINGINVKKTIDNIDFQSSLDKLTLDLKVIGDVKDTDKLTITNPNIEIDPLSYTRSIIRTFYGDSRGKTMEKLHNIISQVVSLTNQLLGKEEFNKNIINLPENKSKVLQDLIPDMSNAIHGLHNLKLTYREDVLTENKLDMLIKKVGDQIDKIKYSMNIH